MNKLIDTNAPWQHAGKLCCSELRFLETLVVSPFGIFDIFKGKNG